MLTFTSQLTGTSRDVIRWRESEREERERETLPIIIQIGNRQAKVKTECPQSRDYYEDTESESEITFLQRVKIKNDS